MRSGHRDRRVTKRRQTTSRSLNVVEKFIASKRRRGTGMMLVGVIAEDNLCFLLWYLRWCWIRRDLEDCRDLRQSFCVDMSEVLPQWRARRLRTIWTWRINWRGRSVSQTGGRRRQRPLRVYRTGSVDYEGSGSHSLNVHIALINYSSTGFSSSFNWWRLEMNKQRIFTRTITSQRLNPLNGLQRRLCCVFADTKAFRFQCAHSINWRSSDNSNILSIQSITTFSHHNISKPMYLDTFIYTSIKINIIKYPPLDDQVTVCTFST